MNRRRPSWPLAPVPLVWARPRPTTPLRRPTRQTVPVGDRPADGGRRGAEPGAERREASRASARSSMQTAADPAFTVAAWWPSPAWPGGAANAAAAGRRMAAHTVAATNSRLMPISLHDADREPAALRSSYPPEAYGDHGGTRPSVAALRYAPSLTVRCHGSRALPLPFAGRKSDTLHRLAGPRPGSRSTPEGRTQWARSTRCRHSRRSRRGRDEAAGYRPLHRQRPLRSVRRQAQRQGAPVSRGLAAVLRHDDHGVPHVPQGGAGRRVQAGRVVGGPSVHRQWLVCGDR